MSRGRAGRFSHHCFILLGNYYLKQKQQKKTWWADWPAEPFPVSRPLLSPCIWNPGEFYLFSPAYQVVQPSDAGNGVIAIGWVARVHHKSFEHRPPPTSLASDSACVSTSQQSLRCLLCSSSDQRELCVFPTIAKVLNWSRAAVKSATLALERNPCHI